MADDIDRHIDRKLEAMQHLMELTRRRERHRAELARLEALRDAELERTRAWFADVSHGERSELDRIDGEIEAWALANRTDRTKSWSTPYAKVTTRPKPGEAVVDDEDALLQWCDQNGYLRITTKPDVKAIRADFAVVDGAVVFPDASGEYRPIPGLHVEGAGTIGVTVKPYDASARDDEEAGS